MEVYLPNYMTYKSTQRSANHMIAKVLNKYLARICLTLHVKDHMVSFDVKSLFTNVPLDETIEICMRKFGQCYGESNCLLFKKLLTFATKDVKFSIHEEGRLYLLSPVEFTIACARSDVDFLN